MALVKDVSTDPVKESEQRKNKGESAAGLFSRITFSWVTPLVSHGFKTQLNKEDLFELSESEDVALLKDKFWEHLNKNLEPGKPCSKWSLFRSLMHVCKRDVIVSGLFMLLYTITQLANPVILRELIIAISDDGYLGLYYATILFISGIISAFGSQFHFHYAYTAGRKVRGLFIALVYERTLQLSSADLASTSSGEIINMFSADAQKFFETSQFMHLFWAGPLQIIVGIVFLLIVIGLPALAGIAMLTLILPINVGTASLKRSLRARHMPLMDKRVKLSTEILSGIRLVKLFSWEKPLMQKLRDVRELQLRYVFKELFLFAAIITILIITPTLSTMATFATYGATGRVLNAGDTFAALAFFNVLKFPLMQISQGMLMGAQSIVATERLFTFLDIKGGRAKKDNLAENTKPVSEARDNDEDSSNKTVVEMTNASFSWQSDIPTLAKATPKKKNSNKKTNTRKESNKKLLEEDESESQTQDKVVLKNIDLTIRQGELVACVGPVGAGKSSLCHALLSELVQVEGKSTFELDKIAYAGQEPWILNDTVENNILFGEEYDEARFRQALDASCLWSDLEQFSDREKTMIGERGVTLSGGQKARISIARAIYSQPDFVILDDPLSALDAHVGKKVFDQLFSPTRGLLRNKTCFLVTHAVQYMSVCDKVIVLYKGRIAFHGSFEDLQNRYVGSDSPDQGTEAADTGSVQAVSNQNMTDLGELSAGSLASVMHSILQSTQESNPERNTESIREASTDVIDSNVVRKPKELFQKDYTSSKLMTTEERKFGSAYAGTLHHYILASGGYLWMIFVILLLIIERVSYVAADYWLSVWTEAETGPPVGALVFDFPAGNTTEGIQFYTNGYIAAIVINAFLVLVRSSAFMYGGGRAARSMFNKLSWSVIRAPIAWFEQTPLGRITNRFSFDTEVIDDLLTQSLNGMVASGFWMLSAIIVMVSVTPPAAALIFPVMVTFAMLHRYYRKSCVDLQRLDSTSRSPIQSHFRESIDGLTTLRAHKQQARFSAITNRMINQNNEAIFAFVSSNRWLGIRLEFLGGLITFAVAVSAWFSRGTISPGLVGLAVLWSFNLTASFNFFVTLSTQAEAKMTSVERVSHYATTLEQEPPLETMGSKPDPSWPAHGGLEFKNVVMRYRPDLPPALNNLNFRVSPGEHVGIVGRSGAGKSSISVVMFRLREASEGTITVDGIDLSQLGLRDVRGRAMFIITQEAVLFSGTIRSNLDMFNEYTDQEVMQALERARIADYVRQIGGINATVEEGGGNLSAGQRQLVALARALLRQPKILLMDEATASCDVETDGHIQETIRREFRSTTVISIAHRLGSIMDFDRVMVMQKGKVAEFDTPANLLEKKGAFHVLVESTGPAMSQQLRQIAIQTQERMLANQ